MEVLERNKKQILQEKVNSMLDFKQRANSSILERIETDNSMLSDFVLPLGEKTPITFNANGTIKMAFQEQEFTLHPNALAQLAEKFNIPTKYVHYLASTPWGEIITTYPNNIKFIEAPGKELKDLRAKQ